MGEGVSRTHTQQMSGKNLWSSGLTKSHLYRERERSISFPSFYCSSSNLQSPLYKPIVQVLLPVCHQHQVVSIQEVIKQTSWYLFHNNLLDHHKLSTFQKSGIQLNLPHTRQSSNIDSYKIDFLFVNQVFNESFEHSIAHILLHTTKQSH